MEAIGIPTRRGGRVKVSRLQYLELVERVTKLEAEVKALKKAKKDGVKNAKTNKRDGADK